MKKINSAVAFALALIGACSFASCGKEEADLKITYYKGGYGSAWIENAVEAFKAEKGITVELVPSSKLTCDAGVYIKSGRNLSDLYICADSTWESLVEQGKIESLTDVYEREVAKSSGEKIKIKDYLDQDVAGKFYMQRLPGQGDFEAWVMPWSAQPGALAYNEDLLKKVTHKTENGEVSADRLGQDGKWIAPPHTVGELKAYFADVNAYNVAKEAGDSYSYVPFGFAGKAPETFYNMIYAWWAQAQGVTASNYAGEGSFFDFWNFGNTTDEVQQTFSLAGFSQTGIAVAIDTFRSLLVDDGDYVNVLSDALRLSAQELQKTFVSASVATKPAIVLASSYLEYETELSGFLDSDKDGKQDVNFKLMSVPALDGYTGAPITYSTYEDVMFIPKEASHKELAKDFLAFLSSEEQLKAFSAVTGSIRPFNYDAREASNNFSAFNESVFDVYYNSTRIFEYPKNTSSPSAVSYVYRFERPTLFGVTELPTVMEWLKTKSGATIMGEVVQKLEDISVSGWERKYGFNR